MAHFQPSTAALRRIALGLVLVVGIGYLPLAFAQKSGSGNRGGGDRDGRGDKNFGGGNGNFGGGKGNDSSKSDKKKIADTSQPAATAPAQPKPAEQIADKAVKKGDALTATPLNQPQTYSGTQAQTEYFLKVTEYYKAASAQTLALGVVATAEGLGQLGPAGTQVGDGETLIAAGLKSLEAGELMKRAEQEAAGRIQAEASAKAADEELMDDAITDEVIDRLVKKTGYTKAEIIDKILSSRGSLDALAEEFEAAGRHREQIELAQQAGDSGLDEAIEASKSGALRRKIQFASLREALTTSATVAKGPAPAEWKKQWVRLATAQASVKPEVSEGKRQDAARAPASMPTEFPNLGENLPSFEQEQSQSDAFEEASLFEQVHRKYTEIGPSMRRPN